jgi:hypothetical protein
MFSAREPDANGMTRSVTWPEACGLDPRVQKKASQAADVVRDQAPRAGEHLADAARAAAAMVTSKGNDEGTQGAWSAGVQP